MRPDLVFCPGQLTHILDYQPVFGFVSSGTGSGRAWGEKS
jgi:hypothetical protein